MGGQVTGTAVRSASVTMHDMHDRRTTVDLVVEDAGAAPALACAAGKAEYPAADGYVTVSPRGEWFDLAPGESRTMTLHLRAQRTVAGVHPLRLWIACGQRRKEQVNTTLRVTG